MPRSNLVRTKIFPYHVYNRTLDKNFYEVPLSLLWSYSCDLLKICTWVFGARIHSFVLMGNHFHLLLSTPDENLGMIMQYFQSELSKIIHEISQVQRFKFAGPYKRTLITNISAYSNVYRYIYQNPIRAGISNCCELYPYSTCFGKFGMGKLDIPIYENELFSEAISENIFEELDWLNCKMPLIETELVRSGLKKKSYKPASKKYAGRILAEKYGGDSKRT